MTRSGSRSQGTWYQYSVDLTAYADQTGYVAIRHFNCSDEFLLLVDDITIVQPGINPDPTWTSVSNVVSPYTLTGLRSGTSYMAVVRSLCDIDSYGEWSEPILFTTESGNAFFTDGNWNEGANWSCATVPTGNDVDVIIAADAIIPAGYVAVVNDIEITGGGSITIEDGGQLVANCNVFATIKKNIIGYGAYNTNTNLGYYLIALPTTIGVSPSNIGLLTTPAEKYDLYSWNRTADYEEWQNYKQGSFSLYNEMGYLYANVNDVEMSITGTLRRSNSNVLWTPPYDSDHHGFNLYGNPFPCNAHIIGRLPYYKMNANGNGFEIVSGWVTIAPMEGFFLESTMENQNRGIQRDEPSGKGSQSGQIDIKLCQNTVTIDNVLVVFEDRETEGVGKLVFDENSSSIALQREGKDYGALFAQSSGEVPVSFVAKTDGSYTLSFAIEGVSFSYLHLVDNLTGENVDLLDTAALRQAQGPLTYTFEAHSGDPVSRFTIVYEVK